MNEEEMIENDRLEMDQSAYEMYHQCTTSKFFSF
jgi:hypothetical protein